MLIVSEEPARVLHSMDGGMSWEIVSGAGLERALAKKVVYDGAGGRSRFLIGTDNGVWSLAPGQGQALALSAGLPLGLGRDVIDLAVPLPGSNGPVALLNKDSDLFFWNDAAQAWLRVFSVAGSVSDGLGALALAPHFDASAPPGPERAVLLAVNGLLYHSKDGGANWALHPQFSTRLGGWAITGLAMAEDYASSGVVILARGRINPAYPLRDQGELWRSGSFGIAYERVLENDSAIMTLAATPADPGGARWFLASAFRYPDHGYYRNKGVFRSSDAGQTWSDDGNHQDFVLEPGPENGTGVRLDLRRLQDFALSPDFASDATVFYGRAEGLFASRDAGSNWRAMRMRPETECRDLAATLDPAGRGVALASTYGSSTLLLDVAAGTAQWLMDGCPFAYQKAIAVSPQFRHDGTLLVSGEYDIAAWYDPALPPANPFGASGWRVPDLIDTVSGQRVTGYPRVISFSPHYDGRGLPGSDQSFYWSSWHEVPMGSLDGGLTIQRLGTVAGGGTAPFLPHLVVAPTYDASSAAGRTDVYGASEETLYRLEDTVWRPVYVFPGIVNAIAVDPGFARPENPRLFLALGRAPFVVEFLDAPSNPGITALGMGLQQDVLTDITLGADYATRPVLYAGTWGRGVLRLDRSAPAPRWEPVAAAFPDWFVDRVRLSPFFTADREVYAGTMHGLVRASDTPGAAWSALPTASLRDDRDPGFTYFAPGDPANLQPARPWPWSEAGGSEVPDGVLATDELLRADFDGSKVECTARASSIAVRTVAGPGQGTVEITAREPGTGAVLAAATVDLAAGFSGTQNHSVPLDLGVRSSFALEIIAHLDPGEVFHFDGVVVVP